MKGKIMKKINPVMISGKEVLPLIEGGKGIAVSDGNSSGAWAKFLEFLQMNSMKTAKFYQNHILKKQDQRDIRN